MFVEKDKFKEKTGVDPDKYISQEALNDFKENIEKSLSFLSAFLMPIVVLNITFVAISLYLKFQYKSSSLYILFFVTSLIISVLGGGTFGLYRAIKRTVEGIRGVTNYTINLFNDVYPLMKKDSGLRALSPSEIYGAISGYIVLPLVKLVVLKRFLGNVFYFFIEKILTKCSGIIISSIDKLSKNPKQSFDNSEFTSINDDYSSVTNLKNPLLEKLSGTFDVTVKGSLIVLKIVSVLSFIVGSVALLILLLLAK